VVQRVGLQHLCLHRVLPNPIVCQQPAVCRYLITMMTSGRHHFPRESPTMTITV
jgi:hypothetical protein